MAFHHYVLLFAKRYYKEITWCDFGVICFRLMKYQKKLVKSHNADIEDVRNKSRVLRNVNFLCATNCATSRFGLLLCLKSECKGSTFYWNKKFF